ncbi:4'-phosphopantetheinyl transferase [Clostridium cavendishii DSM 21758]|uniref:4'-phosphopantetheinyl transferase n=1 Tax=Clostridium cavendishii DSM 21758 TaxID=1121302 RepID=A0A1M6FNT9_9CLOT|nr:4'-phosphopantetheinyl transferase superfamily protein [Clostridium cavendishii]SHI99269.1 4'-phosphopantetheinyl transferase [Clostridium cavendishii DSM 21758]
MDVIIIKTLNIQDENLQKLCTYISCERRTKINKFINKNDKIQTLIAEILIRTKVIKDFNVKNESISFNKNIYGKPYLEKFKNFYFNISHSGNYVAIAINNQEVGIDIEEIKDIEYFDIAKNFFTNEEFNYISIPNKKKSLERFYEIWTLKESYIKFKGQGLSIPLDSFRIIDNDTNLKLISNNDCANYTFNNLNILSDYKLSICRLDNESFNIKTLNQDELISYFLELVEKENA